MSENGLYEFGPFRLDPSQRLLLRDDQPVPLQPKAFETLLVLVRNSEKVVLKDELLNAVWANTFVEESNLTQNIFLLRKALRDGDGGRRYIVTVPGRGYRFAESVRTVPSRTFSLPKASSIAPLTKPETGARITRVVEKPARSGVKKILAAAVLAVLAVSGYFLWRHNHSQPPGNPSRVMLVVLPFQNLTGDPEQDYLAEGITEEITTQLGRLDAAQMGVIARTSAMAYQHTNKRLDQISRELSVQYVVEGSLRRAGERMRITAQLIRVKDQSHLWAGDYDRGLQDILSVQDDVAASVVREVQIRLTPQQLQDIARTRSIDPEAYEDYLKGMYFWNRRTRGGFLKALDYFQAAIARDPDYAQAYAGLASTYVLLGGYGLMPQNEAMPKGKAAALKALAIDDRLSGPYTSLGLIAEQYEWNWAEAGKNFERAIELNPNDSVAHHWYGDGYLVLFNKTDESIAELRKAHELDPLSFIIETDLAARLCFAGQYDESLQRFKKILEADPSFRNARLYLSECYTKQGSYPQAIAEIEEVQGLDADLEATAWLGYIYALSGKRQDALRIADQLREKSREAIIDPGNVAMIYIALDEKDAAFVWLEKAFHARSSRIVGIKYSWTFDPIRSDPRFADLVRRIGLP